MPTSWVIEIRAPPAPERTKDHDAACSGCRHSIVERVLKRAIRHRNNSLFYKTNHGAEVGDIYMSLIHTCALCNINPFAYLQALQMHVDQVRATPALWLPWNYAGQLTATV